MLDLSTRDRCFVIAEAGTAHAAWDYGARFDKAMRYVKAAAWAGADAVKFQWFTPSAGAGDYGDMFCWIDGDEARAPRWRLSELTLDRWRQVKEFAEGLGMVFLASAFQHSTVQWLKELKLEATKVASRAALKFPYSNDLPKPYLISNGMASDVELSEATMALGRLDFSLIQCEARYPSTKAWRGEYPGFSDHSGQPFFGIDAIAHGCKLLEVHFGIDVMDTGPDTPACLTVEELKLICAARDFYAERRVA